MSTVLLSRKSRCIWNTSDNVSKAKDKNKKGPEQIKLVIKWKILVPTGQCQNGWQQSWKELILQCGSSCSMNLQRAGQSPLSHTSCDYGRCNTWLECEGVKYGKQAMGAGDRLGDGNTWWAGDESGEVGWWSWGSGDTMHKLVSAARMRQDT